MSDVVWWFMDMVSDGRVGVGVVEAVPPQRRSKSPRSKRWGEGRWEETHNDKQGVGFQGMLRVVVRPYRQNETDSKIVTTSQGRAFGPSHFSIVCLYVRGCQCLVIKMTSKMFHLQEVCTHLSPCLPFIILG